MPGKHGILLVEHGDLGLPEDGRAEQHGPGEDDQVVICIQGPKGAQFDIEAEEEEAQGYRGASPENAL